MDKLRQAAEQALDALKNSRVFVTSREKTKHPEGTEWYDDCIEALRQALAEPANSTTNLVEPEASFQTEQEPVQFKCTVVDNDHPNGIPLSQWGKQQKQKPLTHEQIESIWDSTLSEDVGITALRKIARAIEAAHGIGEKPAEQEPVGYAHVEDLKREHHDFWVNRQQGVNEVPLYATPSKREWVGLTDEEGAEIWGDAHDIDRKRLVPPKEIVRRIEAKLKEKNGG